MIMKTVNAILIIFAPFLFAGAINRVKAHWAGRKGAPLLQPFFDFVRLLKKGSVTGFSAGYFFTLAPVFSLSAVLCAALLVPMMFKEPIFPVKAAFVIFAYLLAASKFSLIIMSMETGSSFEGMGASRDAAFTAIAEPAFFVAAGTAVMLSGGGGFEALSSFAAKGGARGWLMAWLCAGAFFIMLLTEGSRVPVDDPNTHLELTMIHEVMALDSSGPHLAILSYTVYLKMFLFASIIALCLIPPGVGAAAAAVFYVLIVSACAVITGFTESLMARLRMTHVPQFVFFAVSLAAMLLCAAFILSSWGAV